MKTLYMKLKRSGILVNGVNGEIDWNYIKANIEMIYTIWPTVVADLNALDVNSEDILNFSSVLDKVTLSVKAEDKVTTLNNLVSLYAFLPKYREQFSDDSQAINLDYCKNSIINSYALVEQNNWQEVKKQIENAINYYINIMDGVSTNIQNQNRVSKAYILLNELNSCVNMQDKELYYLKYRNVMEELMNLSQIFRVISGK